MEISVADQDVELLKLQLGRQRSRVELAKWVVIAIGAVVSFWVIDYGKLQLERFRTETDHQRQLLSAYLTATETPQPDVWKRKLRILKRISTDQAMKHWATDELKYIEEFAALDALYRETLKVASQLIEPGKLEDPDRKSARVRFNQLYWADLPYAGESLAVASAMFNFRESLMDAEERPTNPNVWNALNPRLILLSRALRDSTPNQRVESDAP